MILIRADANETIGTGHVMRCLSMAHAFAKVGQEVLFVTADSKASLLLNEFKSVCMNTVWTDMESELSRLSELIDQYKPDLLLVDSYYVTKTFFEELNKIVRIAYIDDMNKECWPIDCLINYNIFSRIYDYTGYDKSHTKLLLSPQYAPLRDEFKALSSHETKKYVTDVLVSAGGADPERVTERIIHEICPRWKSIRFHFIVGRLNPRIKEINQLGNDNVLLHIDEKHMAELMLKCDIAIAASGFTLYELCAAGVPTIAYTLAENQIIAAEQFEKQGLMFNAGDCRRPKQFFRKLETYLRKLMDDNSLRKELSNSMHKLVDGNGADRIVHEILGVH